MASILDALLGQQQPDRAQEILAQRFQPSAQDVGNAALAGISDNSYVNPQQYADQRMTNSMKQLALVQKLSGGNAPSAIREYEYFNRLPPDQKQAFLNVKRSSQIMNLGGSMGVYDPTTGGIGQQFPKTLPPEQTPEVRGQQAAATEQGKQTADAQIALPTVIDNANATLQQINDIRNHPGKSSAVGFSSIIPNRPGGQAKDFTVRLDQLKGGQFLQAYQTLKGAGQISEIEGAKAQSAIARMDVAQSEPEFDAALNDYENVIKQGVQRATLKAGGGIPQGGRTILKTQISPSTGKRKIIYSDGTEEIQ